MSFPCYDEYGATGSKWLPVAPSHWEVKRLKRVFKERDERSGDGGETLLSVSAYTGVSTRAEIIDAGDHLTRADSLVGYKVCYPNDLVVNIMLAWNRGLGVSHQHGIVSPAYSVFAIVDDSNPRYLDYLLRSDPAIGYFKAFSTGVIDSRLRIYPDVFGRLHFPMPPRSEQEAIAAFLDREIAKIDALVAEQEKLITLLKEKRQAVISHAVTKGLDGSVPMKDSGVEWMGQVPAHWDLLPLKRCLSYQEGPGIMATDFFDEGVPLLRIACVQGRWVTLDGCNFLSPEKVARQWSHFKLSAGDLLISGSASMGVVSEVGDDAEGAIAYTGLMRMRGVPGGMTKDFIRWMVVSASFLTQIDLLKAGSTIQHFGPTHLDQMLACCPPLDEQAAIAEHLDATVGEIDQAIAVSEECIVLLRERRSALISAAVTGKIDVRGAVELEPA